MFQLLFKIRFGMIGLMMRRIQEQDGDENGDGRRDDEVDGDGERVGKGNGEGGGKVRTGGGGR